MKKRCSVAPGGLPIILPSDLTPKDRPQGAYRITSILGLVQIVLGLGCVAWEAVLLDRSSTLGDTALTVGVSIGVLFALCGSIGIAAGKNRNSCMMTVFMVLCVLSAILAVIVLFIASLGVYLDKSDYLASNYERHTINNDCVPHHLHRQPAPPSLRDMEINETDGNATSSTNNDINNTKLIKNLTISAPLAGAMKEQRNVSEGGYYWYDPDPPCPVGMVKDHGYRTPRGMLRLVLSMHSLLIVFSVAELAVAIAASAICCNVVCCYSQQRVLYSYAYPAPLSPIPQDVSTQILPSTGVKVQPSLVPVHGMYPMDIPLETAEAAPGYDSRPPSYTSLREKIPL